MFYSPFSNYQNPYSYGNYYTPYHQSYRKQPYYQPSPYHSSYYDLDPFQNYYPTHYPNYDPYEEELRRRNEKKIIEEEEDQLQKKTVPQKKKKQNKTQKNKKMNLDDNTNKMESEESHGSSYEHINSNHDSSFEQITKENIQNKSQQKPDQAQNKNNLQNNLPQFIRIDSKTCIQEEPINYWKEINNDPNKNNLQDGLIEERYPEEIEQKAEKLSKIVQKDYSYCLQIVLQNPDYSMGQYIDIILNKQQKRQQY